MCIRDRPPEEFSYDKDIIIAVKKLKDRHGGEVHIRWMQENVLIPFGINCGPNPKSRISECSMADQKRIAAILKARLEE